MPKLITHRPFLGRSPCVAVLSCVEELGMGQMGEGHDYSSTKTKGQAFSPASEAVDQSDKFKVGSSSPNLGLVS